MPLDRVLEPEVMDGDAEAADYDAMDHAAVNTRFVDDWLATLRPRERAGLTDGSGAVVLDVGTGTALIPLELLARTDVGHVVAVDAAAVMLVRAGRHRRRLDRPGRLTLMLADAKRLPLADGSCRAVVGNSLVHHIPEPVAAFAEMVRVTAPGGRLFVRDLLRPADEATLTQLVATHAGDAAPSQRLLFADSLRAALTVEEIAAFVARWGFPASTVAQTSDRHWTFAATKLAT